MVRLLCVVVAGLGLVATCGWAKDTAAPDAAMTALLSKATSLSYGYIGGEPAP